MSAEPMKITDRRSVVIDEPRSAVVTATPMTMLAQAVAQGMPIEVLRDLMQLKREVEADEARKAFNVAFAAFKDTAIVIVKNTLIKDGPLKGKKHANLFDVVSVVTPHLSKHGLAISWKLTKDEKDWIEVTCTLRHAGGHAEIVSMGGAPDMGPGRNSIQARGSSKSYLERYTATAILGLAATDADDDGNGADKNQPDAPPLPEGYANWVADMKAYVDSGCDLKQLQETWAKSNGDFRRYVVKYDEAWWTTAKNKAKKVAP